MVQRHKIPNPHKPSPSSIKLKMMPKRLAERSIELAPGPLARHMELGTSEGANREPIQIDLGSPLEVGKEIGGATGQDVPITPFLVGAKTRPTTRSVSKMGSSTKTPALTKSPQKC